MLRRCHRGQIPKRYLSSQQDYASTATHNPILSVSEYDSSRFMQSDSAESRSIIHYWVLIPVFLVVPLLMYAFLPTTSTTPWFSTETELGDEPCDRIKILKRCNDLISKDKSRSCMKLGEQFFQQCGDYDQLHRYVNSAARRISEWPQAISSADKLIDLYPHNADFRFMRGKTYEEKGDIVQALPDYEQAMALLPEGIQPPFHLANIYQRLDRPCDAVAPLEQFAFYHPDNAESAKRQLAGLYRNPQCASLQGTGSAKIRIRKGGTIIQSNALINNSLQGKFIIDTGASTVVLSRSFANQLNIRYKNWPVRLMQTANGIALGYHGYIDQIDIQGIKAKRIEAVVSENLGNVDGLLGLSFLGRFDIHINASEGFVQLNQKNFNLSSSSTR